METASLQQLVDYSKQMLAAGSDQATIRTNLLGAGWQQEQVESALAHLFSPIAQKEELEIPHASTTIGKAQYPMTVLWAFKKFIWILAAIFLLLLAGYFSVELLIALPVVLIGDPYLRARFSYQVTGSSVQVFDGKSYDGAKRRHELSFDNITMVEVERGIMDRLFGLADVVISTDEASKKGTGLSVLFSRPYTKRCPVLVGTLVPKETCPRITIPGLSHEHALIVGDVIRSRCSTSMQPGSFTNSMDTI